MSDNDDLITDACPRPPRDNINSDDDFINIELLKDLKDNLKYNIPKAPTTSTNRIPKSTTSSKQKKSPTAFASVININNSNGIHIGSNYNVYMNKTNNKNINNGQKKNFIVTDEIQLLFNNKLPITKDEILFVATHMDEGWRDTARNLNYSDGQISQFYESHFHSGIKEVIYQFLLDWIENEADKATIGRLSTILWNTNQKDVVLRWSKISK